MDAPLGITFFKKVELYQKIQSLDSQLESMNKNKGLHKPLWPIEKKVLVWSYKGHKHLGSPIKTTDFSAGEIDNKLKDFKIDPKEIENINLTQVLDNFIAHGFATEVLEGRLCSGKSPDENKMYLSKEGLLTGEVLNEIRNPGILISYKIWSFLWGHSGAFLLLIFLLVSFLKSVIFPVIEYVFP